MEEEKLASRASAVDHQHSYGGVTLGADAPLGDWLDGLTKAFDTAGVRTAQIDARLLLAHALALTPAQVSGEPARPVSASDAERIAAMADRRLAREPMSRITGVRKFYGRTFKLSPAILDPRRDTELLIRSVLEIVKAEGWRDEPIEILDLGTGSGCIVLTLLAELPLAKGVGTDLSEEALVWARENAGSLDLASRARFQTADWLKGVTGRFHIVTANPPYMTDPEIAALAPEAGAYDPRLALDGGSDGLDAYRSILPGLSEVLVPGGWVVFQAGEGQAAAVERLAASYGLNMSNRQLSVRCDALGTERIIAGRMGGKPA